MSETDDQQAEVNQRAALLSARLSNAAREGLPTINHDGKVYVVAERRGERCEACNGNGNADESLCSGTWHLPRASLPKGFKFDQSKVQKRCEKRGFHEWNSVDGEGKLVKATDPKAVGKVCLCGQWSLGCGCSTYSRCAVHA